MHTKVLKIDVSLSNKLLFISALDKIGMDVKNYRPIFNLFSPSYGISM